MATSTSEERCRDLKAAPGTTSRGQYGIPMAVMTSSVTLPFTLYHSVHPLPDVAPDLRRQFMTKALVRSPFERPALGRERFEVRERALDGNGAIVETQQPERGRIQLAQHRQRVEAGRSVKGRQQCVDFGKWSRRVLGEVAEVHLEAHAADGT